MFKDKIILAVGATGSWGQELTTQLLKFNPKEIRIFSRGEINQVAMDRKFQNPKLKFIIGDVRDYDCLGKACREVDIIFHLAALKHVPVCEEYPEEAIKTNINGVINLINAAKANNVKRVIDVSTDKAVIPINLYGMTKAVGEKLILKADKESKNTRFVVIRSGNALGSSGSVVPHFINQIAFENKVEITDARMTRYFLTLPEAVSLLFTAAESKITGGIFVMRMPSFKILDIAKVLVDLKGQDDTKISIIGMRQGEKINETLISEYEAPNSYIFNDKYYLIHQEKQNLPKVDFEKYTSATHLSEDREEILQLLEKGGFIIRGRNIGFVQK